MRNWHKWQMIFKSKFFIFGGLIYPLSIVERERMWVFDNTDTQGGRGWKATEERVGTLIPLDRLNDILCGHKARSKTIQSLFIPACDMCLRYDLNAHFAVCERDECEIAFFLNDGLYFLLFCEAMRHGYMPIAGLVDTRHFLSEEFTMCARIFPLIDSNIIVNHLVQNSVFNHFFGQVNSHIDTQGEVGILVFCFVGSEKPM